MPFDPAYDERTWEDIKESCGLEDRETIKALAASNYEFFVEYVLGLNTDSELIQELIDVIQNPPEQPQNKATKIVVMAPRGHSKTYIGTAGQILWRAFSETSKQALLSSASRGQSTDILEVVKRIIERNEMLQFLKPTPATREKLNETMDLKDDEGAWATKSIVTTTDFTVKTKTFGSSIRSKHIDYFFCDDILQDEGHGGRDIQTEKDTFYEVITPVVENKEGLLMVVGTPVSHNDLMTELVEKDSYYSSKYQAYDPETGEVLWEWNWTYEQLVNKKQEIGPSRFAKEYMCNPMAVEEQFFPWDECVEPNLTEEPWRPNTGKDEFDDWRFYVGVDIALSDSKEADYTVFNVIGVDSDDQAYQVDMRRKKGMTPQRIKDTLLELDDMYRFNGGFVEKNAIGEGVWSTIEDEPQLAGRVEAFDTTRKTRPEILSKLQAALHGQKLRIHDHDVLKDELMAFHQNSSGKLEGKSHDDTVMSLAIAWKAVRESQKVDASISLIGSDGEETEIELDDEEDSGIDLEEQPEEDELIGLV